MKSIMMQSATSCGIFIRVKKKRRQRLEQNRGYSPERIERMMASQLPEQVFFEHCAVVIDNNGTPEEAIRQVTEILDGTV